VAEDPHNMSVDSVKSTASVITRRSLVFESCNYTITACKDMAAKEVILKLVKKGEKELLDSWPISHPEAVDEEQLTNMGRADLRACILQKNQTGDIQMGILEEEEKSIQGPKDGDVTANLIPQEAKVTPQETPDDNQEFGMQSDAFAFGNIDLENIAKIFEDLIQPLNVPLYTKQVDDQLALNVYIDEHSKYGLCLVKKSEGDQEGSVIDFYVTNLNKQEGLTEEQYKTLVNNYRVKQTDEGYKIDPLLEESDLDHILSHRKNEMPKNEDDMNEDDQGYNIEVEDEEDGEEEEEDFLGLGDKKPKFEVVVVRSKDEDDIVEVYSINVKKNKEIDKRKLKCVFEKNAPPGANDRLLKRIGRRWQADKKTGKLNEIEVKDDIEEDEEMNGSAN
jgi:hypothetical protein